MLQASTDVKNYHLKCLHVRHISRLMREHYKLGAKSLSELALINNGALTKIHGFTISLKTADEMDDLEYQYWCMYYSIKTNSFFNDKFEMSSEGDNEAHDFMHVFFGYPPTSDGERLLGNALRRANLFNNMDSAVRLINISNILSLITEGGATTTIELIVYIRDTKSALNQIRSRVTEK